MKIIVVGIGKLGEYLAQCLVDEGNEVTLIDQSFKSNNNIINNEDLDYVTGSGLDINILKSAKVKEADLVISVMDTDEKNIMCSLLAKKLGAKHTITRIRTPEYRTASELLKEELGLSMVLNPESLTANYIAKVLSIPSVLDAYTFFKGRIEMIGLKVKKGDKFCGLSVDGLLKKFQHHFIICAIKRGEETIIPHGKVKFKPDDKIYIAGKVKEINSVLKYADLIKSKTKKVIISGGSSIAVYLSNILVDMGMSVSIIDNNPERCEVLSQKLPECMIINADISNENILLEEGIEKADAFISLNNIDEENIVYSMYASKYNVPKIVTKINHIHLDGIQGLAKLDTVITPHKIASNQVVQYVRAVNCSSDNSCEAIYRCDKDFELLEFYIKKGSDFSNIKLKNLNLKDGIIIVSILRNRTIIFPNGNDEIHEGDTIIVSNNIGKVQNFKDLLA